MYIYFTVSFYFGDAYYFISPCHKAIHLWWIIQLWWILHLQLTLSRFVHPLDQELSPENNWVKTTQILPWKDLAWFYSKILSSSSGSKSINVPIVIGALIVKHKLGIDDRDTVAMIRENTYLQHFCGFKSFQIQEPFHPTVFVNIGKPKVLGDFDLLAIV